MEVNRWLSKAIAPAAGMDRVGCDICFQGYVVELENNPEARYRPRFFCTGTSITKKKHNQDYNHVVSLSSNQGGCPR